MSRLKTLNTGYLIGQNYVSTRLILRCVQYANSPTSIRDATSIRKLGRLNRFLHPINQLLLGLAILIQRSQNFRNDILIHVFPPQDIKMFITMQPLLNCVSWQLCQHHINVNQAIPVSPYQHNRCYDIPRGESRWTITTDTRANHRADDVVVIHLESTIAHDLEPVNNRLDRGERVEVSVGADFLGL